MDSRLGVTFPAFPLDVRASCELARRAEDLGYTDAWTAEISGADGLAVATALGVATERIRIGCAIVPVYTRPPALLAMGALAAHQASAGRFVLGLGASSPVIVGGWMGMEFERPYTRTADTLRAVRSMLAGDKVSVETDTLRIEGFRLDAPAEVPLYLAALGPRMMDLAASEADGIALYLATETGIRLARETVGDKEVVERILCAPDVPIDDIRPFLKRQITPYLVVPAYNAFIARQGYEAEASKVAQLWRDGDRAGAVEAISDELVDALCILGPAEACKERLDSLRSAGLDTPILWLFSPGGPDGVVTALERMAP